MLNPANLSRMVTEFIFILLGGGFGLDWIERAARSPQLPIRAGTSWLGPGRRPDLLGRTQLKAKHSAGGADLGSRGMSHSRRRFCSPSSDLMMLSLALVEFLRWVGWRFRGGRNSILALRGILAAASSHCVRTDFLQSFPNPNKAEETSMFKEFKRIRDEGKRARTWPSALLSAKRSKQIVSVSFVQDVLLPPIGRPPRPRRFLKPVSESD